MKKDEAGAVRYNAAWALGRIGDSRAVEPLTQALEDHEKAFPYSMSVREAAKKALERINAKKS